MNILTRIYEWFTCPYRIRETEYGFLAEHRVSMIEYQFIDGDGFTYQTETFYSSYEDAMSAIMEHKSKEKRKVHYLKFKD